MAINTSNHLDRKENTTLWTILAIIVVAAAYAAYSHYHNNGYKSTAASTEMGATTNATTPATNR